MLTNNMFVLGDRFFDDYSYREYHDLHFPQSQVYKSWDRERLTEVPGDIPADVKVVDLSTNKIKTLGSGDFQSLRDGEYLDLAHNDVTLVEQGAFNGLNSLKCLYLEVNNLTVLTTKPS